MAIEPSQVPVLCFFGYALTRCLKINTAVGGAAMNILLVGAKTKHPGLPYIYPIQLAYLGSHLMARGHQVRVVDLNASDAPEDRLAEALKDGPYDVAGIAYRNLPPAYWVVGFKSLVQLVRTIRPHADLMVMGGAAFSMFPEVIMPLVPEVDCGVLGEGEAALASLVENPAGMNEVPGVCYMHGGRLEINPGKLPLAGKDIPRYQDIPGLELDGVESVAMQTYRGCENTCGHCPMPFFQGQPVRPRPIKHVMEDIHFLYDRGVRQITFVDAEFNLPWKRANKIMDALLKDNPGVTWEAVIRPIPELNEEYLAKAEESGCVRWYMDLFSGSSDWLSRTFKTVSKGTVEHSVDLLSRRKVPTLYFFSYDLPGETLTQELDTLRLIWSMRRKGAKWADLATCPFLPYPRTDLGDSSANICTAGKWWHFKRTVRYTLRPSTAFFALMILSNAKEAWLSHMKGKEQ